MKHKDKRAIIYLLDAVFILVFFAIAFSDNRDNLFSFKSDKSEDTQVNQSTSLSDEDGIDYRQEMRDWVTKISIISKSMNPDFIIIPQNCTELLTSDGSFNSTVQYNFIDAIDGIGQEGPSYGYDIFNIETNSTTNGKLTDMLSIATDNNIKVIALDYCKQNSKINKASKYNDSNGFIGFQSQNLELTDIPKSIPYHSNNYDIISLQSAQNCIFLLNPQEFDTSEELVQALSKTDYDIIFIDSFFEKDEILSKTQVDKLKTKSNGSKRLVISYLSIGEAEDYRYYFDSSYTTAPPSWLLDENPNWEGNYIVEYWDEEWQSIITSGQDSYLQKIINSGFDGVYLDIVDGYQNFE